MKKILILGLVLVLCLSVVGVGYAAGAWTKELYINGTVSTGSLDATITAGTSYDLPDDGAISSISCSDDGTTLTVTVLNAYPGQVYTQEFTIDNAGSIPLSVPDVDAHIDVATGVTADIVVGPASVAVQGSTSGTVVVNVNDTAAETSGALTFSTTITCTQ